MESTMNVLTPTEAKPFLRWVGGKAKVVPLLAPTITAYLQETGGRYFEPFLGGGAMALHLGFDNMVLNDVIPDLAATYECLRDDALELARGVYQLAQWGTTEEKYYLVRETEPDTMMDQAIRLLYLNAHCFNGIWRTNRSGKMNVPYGKKEDRITDSLIERLGSASLSIKNAEIRNQDFEPVLRDAEPGDLVYLDPPYDDTFNDYAQGGFTGVGQDRLGAELYQAHQKGVAFICHNSDTEKVRSWFSYADLLNFKESRSVNSDGKGRGKANCLLITNRPELLIQAAVAA
jgi:DNA adenine methylase